MFCGNGFFLGGVRAFEIFAVGKNPHDAPQLLDLFNSSTIFLPPAKITLHQSTSSPVNQPTCFCLRQKKKSAEKNSPCPRVSVRETFLPRSGNQQARSAESTPQLLNFFICVHLRNLRQKKKSVESVKSVDRKAGLLENWLTGELVKCDFCLRQKFKEIQASKTRPS